MDVVPPLEMLLIAAPTLVVAYIIFGVAGFGTALIAAPILAHVMPVAAIVPLIALLDCAAAATAGIKMGDKVAKDELIRLVPLMIIGSLVGTYLLLIIPPKPMMLALGVFVVGYGTYGLIAPAPKGTLRARWAGLFGTIGGIFSAMFGSGGFIYAMYLSRRLPDKDAIRATQSTLIGLSTFTRVVIFAIAGIFNDWAIPVLALWLAPAMILGIYAGHRITLKLTRDQFLRVLYVVLIASGAALLLRAI